jgi:hypothetical protein
MKQIIRMIIASSCLSRWQCVCRGDSDCEGSTRLGDSDCEGSTRLGDSDCEGVHETGILSRWQWLWGGPRD